MVNTEEKGNHWEQWTCTIETMNLTEQLLILQDRGFKVQEVTMMHDGKWFVRANRWTNHICVPIGVIGPTV